MTEENEQEMLYKFSVFEKQAQDLQQQIEAVEKGIVELSSLNLGLDDLIGGTGKEIFAPLGKGIFVKAKLISEDLNVDIGNGNFIQKTIPQTKELIVEQVEKLKKVKEDLNSEIERLSQEINDLLIQAESKEKTCDCSKGEKCECEDDCECDED